jgi:hypothetical protein
MQRGVLNAAGTAVTTPLNHPRLAREQQWVDLDRRGNWRDYRWVESPSGTPTTRQQTRQVNGVNEYTAIDPDGTPPPGSPEKPEARRSACINAYGVFGTDRRRPLATGRLVSLGCDCGFGKGEPSPSAERRALHARS